MTNFFSRRQLRRLGKADEGQALVLTALGLIVLMLMTGLGVDVGYLRYQHQQMQKAADAGAIAAAITLTSGDWNASAIADAGANGFTNGNNNISVTAYNPPIDPPFNSSTDTSYVEVVVSQPRPTFFMRVAGSLFDSVTVSARAVGVVQNSSGCIYVLDPGEPTDSGNNAFVVSGSGELISSCGVKVNSNSTQGFVVSGSACVTAPYIDNVAGSQDQVNQTLSGVCGQGGKGMSPNPPTQISAFTNPMAYVQLPSDTQTGPCTYTGTFHVNASTPEPIQQGIYCGGITVDSFGGTAQFGGLYIIRGGALKFQGGATVESINTSTTNGVTFVLTGTASQGYNDYQGVTISSGNSTVTLSAPTSAPTGNPTLEGVLFFEDPNVPWNNTGSSQKSQISGGANTTFSGALYFPTTYLAYTGGSSLASYTQIVAYQLAITGNSVISDSGTGGILPVNTALLAQ